MDVAHQFLIHQTVCLMVRKRAVWERRLQKVVRIDCCWGGGGIRGVHTLWGWGCLCCEEQRKGAEPRGQ